MRLPDPIANTTTEAYLAYKAGVLAEGDLKPKLYEPYIHLDAWLAYWAGLTTTYPVKGVGKNLFNLGTNLDDYFLTADNGLKISTIEVSDRVSATISGGTLEIDSYNQANWCWLSKWVEIPKNTKITVSAAQHMQIKIVGFNNGSNNGTELLFMQSDESGLSFDSGNYDRYAISLYPHSAGVVFEDVQIEKGSTATAYEPYTGEPEMLTDEEAYIAYLSGVTDTYPEEFRDPADIRVAAYLRYLISARFSRPEYPVTNEEFYLSLMKTKYIPSGDPSTDIEIDGTAEAPFGDVKMYGDTFQQSYTGKNLYNVEAIPYVAKRAYSSDGSVVNWTNYTGTDEYQPVEPNTEYTIWNNKARDTTYLCEYDENKNFIRRTVEATTFTTTATTKYLRWSIYAGAGEIPPTKTQLELGLTSTLFEPYVGGQPSPNPDYPQPIQTVTGRQTVKVLGKNLLNITSPEREITNAGLHITIEDDGKITIDGTATGSIWPDLIWGIRNNTGSHNSCKYYFPKALEAVTYSIKIVNGTVTDSPSISVVFNDDGGKNVNIRFDQPQVKTVTGVNGINRAYLTGVKSGTTFNNFQFYLQIESGTTATEVVPYSELDYEIDLGDIELCKLGTYQDYIWKDGEDWKVHKELGNVTLDSTHYNSRYGTNSYGLTQFLVELGVSDYYDISGYTTMLSDSFVKQTTSFSKTQVQGFLPALDSNSHKLRAWIRISTTTADTTDQFKAWLNTNTPIFYYKLNTATDTVITDQTLIAQLEALVSGGAENGTTYIKVDATDPNLPGLLYVEAPKYE